MKSSETNFDVVIIGAGPAGLTAGMYAARQGLKTAIVGGEVGGQALWASEVENFIGWRLISGKELIQNFREHAATFGVVCFEGELINAIIPGEDGFDIFTREGTALKSKAIIISTGRAPNRLAVPGEQEFIGRGVSYCATCDGAFFRDKPVIVVGSGDSAADAALELATLGARVNLVTVGAIKIQENLLKRVEEHENVTLLKGLRILEIKGDDSVKSILVRNSATKEEEEIETTGVFIETGAIAASEFSGGLIEMNERGEIITGKDGSTNVPGIFAAGDVTDTPGKQIIIAAGEGARAAMAVSRYLKRR